MFIRRILIFLSVFLAVCQYGSAQDADFCEAVSAILRDAPNQFRNVHGGLKESDATSSIFKTNIKVPGVIQARFVSSMGLFYEGALFQSSDKESLKAAYTKYKTLLDSCLTSQGYHVSTTDNFYAETAAFKKVIYMKSFPPDADLKKLPGHVAMEVDYMKPKGVYTLTFYIFEH